MKIKVGIYVICVSFQIPQWSELTPGKLHSTIKIEKKLFIKNWVWKNFQKWCKIWHHYYFFLKKLDILESTVSPRLSGWLGPEKVLNNWKKSHSSIIRIAVLRGFISKNPDNQITGSPRIVGIQTVRFHHSVVNFFFPKYSMLEWN